MIARTEQDLAAIDLVRSVRAWAISAYQWEAFWNDMSCRPESQFENNGKKLRDFIAAAERIFPELKDERIVQ
jgi:hypothetical protein